MSKWIDFIDCSKPGQKTKIFLVHNKENLFKLGCIKWYGPFRKYSFFPESNTVFESTCMMDILKNIAELTEERKIKQLS